jgi:hypothetical protein
MASDNFGWLEFITPAALAITRCASVVVLFTLTQRLTKLPGARLASLKSGSASNWTIGKSWALAGPQNPAIIIANAAEHNILLIILFTIFYGFGG